MTAGKVRKVSKRLFAEAINLLVATHIWERLPHRWHMRIWRRYSS